MLTLRRRQGTLSRTMLNDFDSIIAKLPALYRPILKPAITLQAEILGLLDETTEDAKSSRGHLAPPGARSRVMGGEILTDGENLYAIALRELAGASVRRNPDGTLTRVTPEERRLQLDLNYISPTLSLEPLENFEALIRDLFSIELDENRYTSDRLDELKSEGMEPPQMPSPREFEAARFLADRSIRTLTVAVKSSAGLLIGDLPKQLPPGSRERVDELTSAMTTAGLVSAELVVICTITQAQVARTPSTRVLKDLSKQGVRCACGKPIGDERIEEAVAVTDLGRVLLDKSRWFSLLLLQELLALGIPLDRILIDQQVGGDEMDCMADLNGDLVFFELKDKEFSLGNAYSFGAKIGIVRPGYRVIATTEHVGNDAKDHFQRADVATARRRYDPDFYDVDDGPRAIRYIEGTQNLRPELESLITEINSSDANRILTEITPLVALNPRRILNTIEQRKGAHALDTAVVRRKAKKVATQSDASQSE